MTSFVLQEPGASLYRPGEEPGVAAQPVARKLAAIFAADIAGYSRLMAHDEVGTLTRLKTCRVISDGLIATPHGERDRSGRAGRFAFPIWPPIRGLARADARTHSSGITDFFLAPAGRPHMDPAVMPYLRRQCRPF
jgi:class 3 adenylate cyclase